jgi:hypothetical protein
LQYFFLASYGVLKRREYDKIFIWQQYIGIYYYLLSLLWPLNKKPTVVFYIIYKTAKNNTLNNIKKLFFLKAFNSRIFERVLFTNKKDYLYDKISGSKKDFINFYHQPSSYIENNYGKVPVRNKYFSGGVSNRMYSHLLALAKNNPSLTINIAGTPEDKAALKDISSNLIFITGAYGKNFEQLLMESKAVIIPLEDPNVVSGQLVVLRALQAGKVVIMTENTFWSDWLKGQGKNDFIYLYEGIGQLEQIINSLDDIMLETGGKNARRFYKQELHQEKMYNQLTKVILHATLV